ncbi:ABC transporter permease [Aquabacter spiritensis]|nr:ABC transporter permease [Aquabacter spiritensis]
MLRTGFARQRNIFRALLIRDLMTRFRREGLGFAWLVLEPALLIVIVIGIWSVQYGSTSHGVGIVPMVLTGYGFLTVWRHILGRSNFALRGSIDLKYHREVQYGDIILSRYLLEIGGTFLAFWTVYLACMLLGMTEPIQDLFTFCLAWVLMAAFSIGFGLNIVAITELWETSERFIPPLMYATLPFTGVFFLVEWLPQRAQDVVVWSPLVNAVELLRAGYWGQSFVSHADIGYLTRASIITLAIGLGLMEVAKRRIKSPS